MATAWAIPTVNGAIYFDDRYLGNPLVYCGNVGLIPRDKSDKNPRPNDLIVALGGERDATAYTAPRSVRPS